LDWRRADWGVGWLEDGWEKSVNFSVGLNVTFSGFLFQKRFDVLKAVNMKVMVFLNMTPYTQKTGLSGTCRTKRLWDILVFWILPYLLECKMRIFP
jgi:hypothetical protein